MDSAIMADALVNQAGLEINVINFHVILDAVNMANVKMELAYARGVGMDDIAL